MSFYVTGGSLQSDAPSYVARQADKNLLDCLLDGEFCYVLTARQMGKSSLMVRTATRLRSAGIQVAALDLTAIGGQNVSPDQWYHGLLDTLGQELNLEDELEVFWHANSHLGALHRLMKALRQIVLGRLASERDDDEPSSQLNGTVENSSGQSVPTAVRLVIFIDEIDFVRSLPFSVDEFFAAIRECYNHRSLDPGYKRLTFCLLGVASPADLIKDTHTTPFNIGRRIELNDFTPDEAAPLAQGLRPVKPQAHSHEPTQLLERILYWTDGHPYLTQKLCRVTAEALNGKERPAASLQKRTSAFVDEVCADLFLSHRARERDDNLIFVRERLLRSEDIDIGGLLELYRKVWRGSRVIDDELDPLAGVLRLSGVARVKDGLLRERNRIYRRVFDAEWVRANLPEAELRRQRQAYRRGAILAATLSGIVLLIMASLVVAMMNETKRHRAASAQAHFAQAQTKRLSGRAGQRLESLEALNQAAAYYPNKAELRDEIIASLALVDLEPLTNSAGSPGDVVAFAANNRLTHRAIADSDNRIRIQLIAGDRTIHQMAVENGPVHWMALSPSSAYLAVQSGKERPRLTVWDWQTQKPLVQLTNTVTARALDFSPASDKVAIGLPEGRIALFSLPDGKELHRVSSKTGAREPRRPTCIAFDPSGSRIAEASSSSSQVLLHTLSEETPSTIELGYHRSPGAVLAWHPDGQSLAVATEARDIYIWGLKGGAPSQLSAAHFDAVQDIAFNRAGDLLATVSADSTLKLWTHATGRHVLTEFNGDATGRLLFTPDDRQLTHWSPQGQVFHWRVENPEAYRVFRSGKGANAGWTGLSFGSDGRMVLSGSSGGLHFWDAATGLELASIPVKGCQAAFLDPVHGHLYASTAFGFFRWAKLNSKTEAVLEFGPPEPFSMPAGAGASGFSGGDRQASVLHEDHVHLVALDDPLASNPLPIRGRFQSTALSSSGEWLAAWSEEENKLRVWELKDASLTSALPKVLDSGQQYAFSPDGEWVLTSWRTAYRLTELRGDRQVTLPITGARTGQQTGPIAFAPSDKNRHRTLLAVAVRPTVVKIFELNLHQPEDCQEWATLVSPDRHSIAALAFDSQRTRLAASTSDQTVEVWDLAAINSQLTRRGFSPSFPRLPSPSASVPRIKLDPTPLDTDSPRRWMDVEWFTFALAKSVMHSPSENANLFVSRGRVLLDLQLSHLAISDLKQALRLQPGHARAEELLRKATSRAAELPVDTSP